jgi:hypothetical protein
MSGPKPAAQSSTRAQKLATGLVVLLITIVGAAILAFYSSQKRDCVRLLRFEETEGILIHVENVGNTLRPVPGVAYTYDVGGVEYSSRRYSYNDYQRYYPPVAWLAVYGKRAGRSVPVFYDPEDPSFAILDYWSEGKIRVRIADCKVNMIVGGIVLAFGVLGLAYTVFAWANE